MTTHPVHLPATPNAKKGHAIVLSPTDELLILGPQIPTPLGIRAVIDSKVIEATITHSADRLGKWKATLLLGPAVPGFSLLKCQIEIQPSATNTAGSQPHSDYRTNDAPAHWQPWHSITLVSRRRRVLEEAACLPANLLLIFSVILTTSGVLSFGTTIGSLHKASLAVGLSLLLSRVLYKHSLRWRSALPQVGAIFAILLMAVTLVVAKTSYTVRSLSTHPAVVAALGTAHTPVILTGSELRAAQSALSTAGVEWVSPQRVDNCEPPPTGWLRSQLNVVCTNRWLPVDSEVARAIRLGQPSASPTACIDRTGSACARFAESNTPFGALAGQPIALHQRLVPANENHASGHEQSTFGTILLDPHTLETLPRATTHDVHHVTVDSWASRAVLAVRTVQHSAELAQEPAFEGQYIERPTASEAVSMAWTLPEGLQNTQSTHFALSTVETGGRTRFELLLQQDSRVLVDCPHHPLPGDTAEDSSSIISLMTVSSPFVRGAQINGHPLLRTRENGAELGYCLAAREPINILNLSLDPTLVARWVAGAPTLDLASLVNIKLPNNLSAVTIQSSEDSAGDIPLIAMNCHRSRRHLTASFRMAFVDLAALNASDEGRGSTTLAPTRDTAAPTTAARRQRLSRYVGVCIEAADESTQTQGSSDWPYALPPEALGIAEHPGWILRRPMTRGISTVELPTID